MQTELTVTPGVQAPGHFCTIQDAIDSIPSDNHTPVTIRIAPGIYREKLTLEKPCVTLLGLGDSPSDTVLSYDDFGNDTMPDGSRRGTFRSYTLFVHAADVTLRNLTVENASGDSATHGQAIALYVECDRFVVDSCRLLGHQDTLFTGPLPPKEIQKNGFIGPTQFAPRINGRQYYKNCYICGDIDFIFGSATAFFENCELESLHRGNPDADAHNTQDARTVSSGAATKTSPYIEGYVTAASTPEGQEYGYVFSHCRFLGSSCAAGSVYLGRPWRNFAKTVLISCELGSHIHPAGFHDWNKTEAHGTLFYAEYNSIPVEANNCTADFSLPSAGGCTAGFCRPYPHRADFVTTLDAVEAEHFTRQKVLCGTDNWLVSDVESC